MDPAWLGILTAHDSFMIKYQRRICYVRIVLYVYARGRICLWKEALFAADTGEWVSSADQSHAQAATQIDL